MNEIWNNEFEDEKSISLMDMLFYILRQWKKMMVAAAVAALIIVAFSAFKSFRLYQTMKSNPNAVPIELTEAETQGLNDKLQAIKVYEDSVNESRTYLEQSIMCKLDPNGLYEGTLYFAVTLQSEAEVLNAKTICETEILNTETYEKVAEVLGEDAAVSKIGEVIGLSVDKTATQGGILMTLKITSRYYTEDGCQKMLDTLTEVVQGVNLRGIRNDIGSFEKLSERVLLTSDASLVDRKQSILNTKNTAAANLTNAQNSLTENERKYQEWLATEDRENAEPQFELNIPWKYVILATIVGAFCVAGIYGIIYLFNGRIHNKEELESYMKLPIFDMASDSNKGNTPEMIAVLVAGHLSTHGLKKVYLSGSLGRQQAHVLNKIKELVKEKGFTVEVGKSILADAESLQKATDCGYMVFVEKCHESMEKDLREEISKAMFCGIRVLGVILEN